jgi:hypothetical protein
MEVVMSRKSTCPISRSQFRAKAKPVSITVNEVPMVAPTKEFATGSLGWYLNGKTVIDIDGTAVTVQLGLSLTVVGSKELPPEPEQAPAKAEAPKLAETAVAAAKEVA